MNWIFLPIMDSNPSAYVFKGGLMPLLHETVLLFFVTDHYNISSWLRKILHVIWTYFYECLFFTWGGPISHGVFIMPLRVSLHLLWRRFRSFTLLMSPVSLLCRSLALTVLCLFLQSPAEENLHVTENTVNSMVVAVLISQQEHLFFKSCYWLNASFWKF